VKLKRNASQSNSLFPVVLIGIGVLLIVSVLVWQFSRETASSLPTPTSAQVQQDLPFPDIKRVSVQDARQAFDEQKAVFLDVRDADSYANSHIPGALNIPLSEIENRLKELDPDQWIITYCT